MDLDTESHPMRLPHRVSARILATFPDAASGDDLETRMHEAVAKDGGRWELNRISDRPAMASRSATRELSSDLAEVAKRWEIPFATDSSVWPSVAGLVPDDTAALCGIGPVARDLGTPHESVLRISLVQRTLLLAQYLLGSNDG
jgi:D-alanine-D-alanine ligase